MFLEEDPAGYDHDTRSKRLAKEYFNSLSEYAKGRSLEECIKVAYIKGATDERQRVLKTLRQITDAI